MAIRTKIELPPQLARLRHYTHLASPACQLLFFTPLIGALCRWHVIMSILSKYASVS